MSSPFEISWADFGIMTNKFLERIKDPAVSLEALDGAKSAWGLHYLNLDFGSDPLAKVNSKYLFQLVMLSYINRIDTGR